MVPGGLRKPGLSPVKSYWTSPPTGDPWGPDLRQLPGFSASCIQTGNALYWKALRISLLYRIKLDLCEHFKMSDGNHGRHITGAEAEQGLLPPQVLYRNHQEWFSDLGVPPKMLSK